MDASGVMSGGMDAGAELRALLFDLRAMRGAMIAFSTFDDPQAGQVTRPRFACLS